MHLHSEFGSNWWLERSRYIYFQYSKCLGLRVKTALSRCFHKMELNIHDVRWCKEVLSIVWENRRWRFRIFRVVWGLDVLVAVIGKKSSFCWLFEDFLWCHEGFLFVLTSFIAHLSELNATTLNLNSIFASMLQKHDKYWDSVNKTNQYFYFILKGFFILILSSEILSGHLIKFMRLEVTFQKTWPRMLRIICLNYTIGSRLPMIKWMRPHNLLVHQTTNQNL